MLFRHWLSDCINTHVSGTLATVSPLSLQNHQNHKTSSSLVIEYQLPAGAGLETYSHSPMFSLWNSAGFWVCQRPTGFAYRLYRNCACLIQMVVISFTGSGLKSGHNSPADWPIRRRRGPAIPFVSVCNNGRNASGASGVNVTSNLLSQT